ncbi:IS3 family transposase [Gracilibacillus sp. S3-1-1]|uniref:IS3 family transposase n=1 Tax=Gracilibacillus pellucidus TaxID=3095368 RepID=A0ACC6M1E9_9BACI|nr:IS3 family transposase [Gracilibacillus sp. S3-1-1]MDX8044764.1 IS3 family transposase [Gracilibacillus sp. S3-1-1]
MTACRECLFKKAPSFRDKYSDPTAKTESRIIQELRKEFKLAVILEATGFPKATYMYWQKRFAEPNPTEEIEKVIQDIIAKHNGNYGYRRIDMELRKRGSIVNHKKILRITNKLGITCSSYTRKSRKYSTYKGTIGRISKNIINRRFYTSIPRQKLTTDTSEFKYYTTDSKGTLMIKKAYLNPFLDMFNGEILSFRLSKRPNARAIMDALDETMEAIKNCPYRTTIHSDQGWDYQMKQYVNKLKANGIFQSMFRKGNCLDNSPMENFFGIMKQEMYYGKVYRSFEELEQAVNDYIFHYNNHRIKAKLTGMSSVEYRLHTSQLAT